MTALDVCFSGALVVVVVGCFGVLGVGALGLGLLCLALALAWLGGLLFKCVGFF